MKQNNIYNVLLVALIIVATWSCERDDICAEATVTTPHLIIRFYDVSSPEELKDARRLSVRGFDAEGNELDNIVFNTDTDSIVLPLRFQGEVLTTSRFILEKDTDFGIDEDPLTDSNIDIINVNYTPEFVYVSRACGYKSIFTNVSINREPDTNNWILGSEIINTTIENEDQTHVILRH